MSRPERARRRVGCYESDVYCLFSELVALGLSPEELETALERFAERPDVEIVGPGDPATLAGTLDYDSLGSYLELTRPEGFGATAPLLDIARVAATTCRHPIRVVAAGALDDPARGPAELAYAVFDLDEAGRSRSVRFPSGDAAIERSRRLRGERLRAAAWELLGELLLQDRPPRDGPMRTERLRFMFRVTSAPTDRRLLELADQLHSATTVAWNEQPDGRYLLQLRLADGSRRVAYLSADEAEQLRRPPPVTP